jgi:multiple sugar transport system permease protein
MSYLQSVPRRIVTLYPAARDHRLHPAVSVLLDGFDLGEAGRAAARSRQLQSVLDLESDLQALLQALFESYYPHWLWNTMYVAVCATVLSIIASVLAAYAIVRCATRAPTSSAG